IEKIDKLWDTSLGFQTNGELEQARKSLRQYLENTQAQRYSRWSTPKDVQQRRNSAIDKLDALGELDHGASKAAVAEYLAARTEYDGACRQDEVLKHLSQARQE